jgi:hypothetical protein
VAEYFATRREILSEGVGAMNDANDQPAARPDADKHFATAQARAALLGYILHRIEDDRGVTMFIITRWALTRELRDLEAVERWLEKVGAT